MIAKNSDSDSSDGNGVRGGRRCDERPALSIGATDIDYRKTTLSFFSTSPPIMAIHRSRLTLVLRVSVRHRWLLLLHACSGTSILILAVSMIRSTRSKSASSASLPPTDRRERNAWTRESPVIREWVLQFKTDARSFPDDTWNCECKCAFVRVDYTLSEVHVGLEHDISGMNDLFNYENIILRITLGKHELTFRYISLFLFFLMDKTDIARKLTCLELPRAIA